MLKVVVLAIGLFLVVTGFIFMLNNKKTYPDWNGYKVVDYKLEGVSYRLAVADTPAKWEQGLMYVVKPVAVQGMVFIFPNEKYREFWNQNTHLDLQLFWLSNGTVVQTNTLPSIDKSGSVFTIKSQKVVDTVIEIIK